MIERLYPGVYVAEIPLDAQAIDGVPTSGEPDWTDHNTHDPGVTLMELLVWSMENALFGAPTGPAAWASQTQRRGVAEGLGVAASDGSDGTDVHVTAGAAVSVDGRPIATNRDDTIDAAANHRDQWQVIDRVGDFELGGAGGGHRSQGGTAVVLDEADALFDRRSEGKDAHDRYADQEVSRLPPDALQRADLTRAETTSGRLAGKPWA